MLIPPATQSSTGISPKLSGMACAKRKQIMQKESPHWLKMHIRGTCRSFSKSLTSSRKHLKLSPPMQGSACIYDAQSVGLRSLGSQIRVSGFKPWLYYLYTCNLGRCVSPGLRSSVENVNSNRHYLKVYKWQKNLSQLAQCLAHNKCAITFMAVVI